MNSLLENRRSREKFEVKMYRDSRPNNVDLILPLDWQSRLAISTGMAIPIEQFREPSNYWNSRHFHIAVYTRSAFLFYSAKMNYHSLLLSSIVTLALFYRSQW